MNEVENKIMIPEEVIMNKIYFIRGQKVMLDRDLAEFYGVETKVLKQAVRRNIERFPADFMYELTNAEIEEVVSQNVIPSKKYFGGAVPYAFTENGVAMLSGVLNSKKAIDINIAIIRAFTLLRKTLLSQKDIIQVINQIRVQLQEHDNNINVIFEYLKQFEEAKQQQFEQTNRKRIGFKTDKE